MTIKTCQGRAVYNYSQDGKDKINLTLVSNNACPSSSLITNLNNSVYFRARGTVLDLFDSNIQLSLEMTYLQAYNSSQSIFSPPTNIFTNSTLSQPTNSNVILPASFSTVSVTNLQGIWKVLSLFGIPFQNSLYSIQLNSSQLILSGGCNTFNYNYTLNPSLLTMKV